MRWRCLTRASFFDGRVAVTSVKCSSCNAVSHLEISNAVGDHGKNAVMHLSEMHVLILQSVSVNYCYICDPRHHGM